LENFLGKQGIPYLFRATLSLIFGQEFGVFFHTTFFPFRATQRKVFKGLGLYFYTKGARVFKFLPKKPKKEGLNSPLGNLLGGFGLKKGHGKGPKAKELVSIWGPFLFFKISPKKKGFSTPLWCPPFGQGTPKKVGVGVKTGPFKRERPINFFSTGSFKFGALPKISLNP